MLSLSCFHIILTPHPISAKYQLYVDFTTCDIVSGTIFEAVVLTIRTQCHILTYLSLPSYSTHSGSAVSSFFSRFDKAHHDNITVYQASVSKLSYEDLRVRRRDWTLTTDCLNRALVRPLCCRLDQKLQQD